MKQLLAKLLCSKSVALRKIPSLFLLFAIGFIGWTVACSPVPANSPSAQSQAYIFYLYNWSEDNQENRLIPLDPETLEDQPEGEITKLGRTWRLSPNGATLVNVEYVDGRDPRLDPNLMSEDLKPEDVWLVVHDLQTGVERSRFHPPATASPLALSRDGSRLLLTASGYPQDAEWYILDTSSGAQVARGKDSGRFCRRVLFDPNLRQRIYCQVDPAEVSSDGPRPIHIVAYDVDSGTKVGELELPEVLIGGEDSDQILNSQPVRVFFDPAIEISPDGQRLAVIHADEDKITLVDARSLNVEKTISLERSTSLWDWFGFVPAVAHAKREMQGTIRHAAFSSDGHYLYLFSQEVWVRLEDAPAERGFWLVDLERGTIEVEALPEHQIQWVRPAPDGAIYVFGTTDERLLPYEIRTTSPSTLWRLDSLTLEILAERAFTGYRQGWLVEETAE